MPIGDYLPGISAAIADIAKTRAAVEAMRFDKLVQMARLKQEAKSEQQYRDFQRNILETKNRMDIAAEDLRFTHEKTLLQEKLTREENMTKQKLATDLRIANMKGSDDQARAALLTAQTALAGIQAKSLAFETYSKPLNEFWKDRGITPDVADETTKNEYNSLIDTYNQAAQSFGWPQRPKLPQQAAKSTSAADIMSQLPEAKSSGGVFKYIGGTLKQAYNWWDRLGKPPETHATQPRGSGGGY